MTSKYYPKQPLYNVLIQVIADFTAEKHKAPLVIILPEGSLAILERELMNTSITLSTSPTSSKPCATFYGVYLYEENQVANIHYDF